MPERYRYIGKSHVFGDSVAMAEFRDAVARDPGARTMYKSTCAWSERIIRANLPVATFQQRGLGDVTAERLIAHMRSQGGPSWCMSGPVARMTVLLERAARITDDDSIYVSQAAINLVSAHESAVAASISLASNYNAVSNTNAAANSLSSDDQSVVFSVTGVTAEATPYWAGYYAANGGGGDPPGDPEYAMRLFRRRHIRDWVHGVIEADLGGCAAGWRLAGYVAGVDFRLRIAACAFGALGVSAYAAM